MAAGLTEADIDSVEVWPENWTAFELFVFMQTQWRVGFSGAIGLDYGVLYKKMDRMGLSAQDYDQLEADVQVMELAALGVMNTKPGR